MVPENFISQGFHIGFIVAAIIFVVWLIGAVYGLVQTIRGYDISFGVFALVMSGIVVVPLCVASWMPFNPTYQQIYNVTGTITDATNVFESGSGEVTSMTVLTLDSVSEQLIADDPRLTSLVGEEVTLACTINWEYMAQDKYECKLAKID